jgi:uncharacterized membrane protein
MNIINTPFSDKSIENFYKSLGVMGKGMIGIFVIMIIVAILIIVIKYFGHKYSKDEISE